MTGRTVLVAASLAAAALLAACGERPQVAATGNHDATPYQGTGVAAFTAGNWKAGDRTAWEQQLKTRAQGQNDYAKVN